MYACQTRFFVKRDVSLKLYLCENATSFLKKRCELHEKRDYDETVCDLRSRSERISAKLVHDSVWINVVIHVRSHKLQKPRRILWFYNYCARIQRNEIRIRKVRIIFNRNALYVSVISDNFCRGSTLVLVRRDNEGFCFRRYKAQSFCNES